MVYLAMKKPGFEADKFSLMLKDLKNLGIKRSCATLGPQCSELYICSK